MLKQCRRYGVLTLSFVLISAAPPALGQDETASKQAYVVGDFDHSKPRTALEMVYLIPGFTLTEAEARRGLGQGGANALIDGERVSGKIGVFDQLSKISIRRVARIEILDGAKLDVTGLVGSVVNVITQEAGTSGSWEWNPQFRNKRSPDWFNSEFTISKNFSNLSTTFKLKNDSFRNGHTGPKSIFDPAGNLYETREENAQYYSDRPSASLNLGWKGDSGSKANFDIRYHEAIFKERQRSHRTAQTEAGAGGFSLYTEDFDKWGLELNADYEQDLGIGALKVIGVYESEHLPFSTQFELFEDSGDISGRRLVRTSDSLESILRAEYGWSNNEKSDWQASIESAYNELRQESELFKRELPDVFAPDALDDPQTLIEEQRYEAAVTYNRYLTEKLDIQASLGVEFSEISLTSNASQTKDFVRPNGFINASYAVSDSFKIRGKFERKVGQLDFAEFTSSADVVDGLDRSANSELVPSQSWNSELEFEKNFSNNSTFTARFFYAHIDDLVDRIPVGLDRNAIGNLESAKQFGADLITTIRGDEWGITNSKLDINLQFRETEVEDPITGLKRDINDSLKTSFLIRFRQDIPSTDIAYGIHWDQGKNAQSFHPSTITNAYNDKSYVSAMIEHKDLLGVRVRISARNLTDIGERRHREFYDTRRDIGGLQRIESRTRYIKPYVVFTISDTF